MRNDFHTIESILKPLANESADIRSLNFHTIESILKPAILTSNGLPVAEFPYY